MALVHKFLKYGSPSKEIITYCRPIICCEHRKFSTSNINLIKRKHISKWKNGWPTQVYFEADLEERCFDKLLDTPKSSKLQRRRTFKSLLASLVQQERVITTFDKGRALSRLAEHLIDTAKKGDEPGVYYLMQRKELVPIVFEEILPRYINTENSYTNCYRLHSRCLQVKSRGKNIYKKKGNAVVEFKGNSLPPLLPSEEVQLNAMFERAMKIKEEIDAIKDGSSV